MIRALVAAATVFAFPTVALADVLEIQPVTDHVWAVVGPLEQRSPDNLANNATFGLVVTPEGAVLMDAGGSWQGAEMLHAAIRTVTEQPGVHVINTGGQDHRWLGNGYWQAQGATVITSEAAVEDHRARADDHMIALSQFPGEGLERTEPAYADATYQTDYTLRFGGLCFEIMHRGAAHMAGDSFVWLDERDVMFTGDIVYVDRLLGNGPARDTDSWIAVFEALAGGNPVMAP